MKETENRSKKHKQVNTVREWRDSHVTRNANVSLYEGHYSSHHSVQLLFPKSAIVTCIAEIYFFNVLITK